MLDEKGVKIHYVMESFLIRICSPSFNKSYGCLDSDNSDGIIELYYQDAEWEEKNVETRVTLLKERVIEINKKIHA